MQQVYRRNHFTDAATLCFVKCRLHVPSRSQRSNHGIRRQIAWNEDRRKTCLLNAAPREKKGVNKAFACEEKRACLIDHNVMISTEHTEVKAEPNPANAKRRGRILAPEEVNIHSWVS